jgi:CHAT domain-containing protein
LDYSTPCRPYPRQVFSKKKLIFGKSFKYPIFVKNQLIMIRFILLLTLFAPSCFLKAQSPDSLATSQQIDSLIKVSRDLTGKRDFEQALAVNAEAERVALEVFGRVSAEYGNACFNRGRVMHFKGDLWGAKKHYKEALSISAKAIGTRHIDYAVIQVNLATVHSSLSLHEGVEEWYVSALSVFKEMLGKSHPNYYTSLFNLSSYYRQTGAYYEAETALLEAIEIQKSIIRENVNGTMPSIYPQTISALAELYVVLNLTKDAEHIFLEAIEIQRHAPEMDSLAYARSLRNLAGLYVKSRDYQKANALFQEVLDIYKSGEIIDSLEYATTLIAIGRSCKDQKLFEESERLFIEASDIRKAILGENSRYYASSLGDLGQLYRMMKRFQEAEVLYLKARKIYEEISGEDSDELGTNALSMILLYRTSGHTKKAGPYFVQYAKNRQTYLSRGAYHLSAQELQAYANRFTIWLDDLYSYAHSYSNPEQYILGVAYDATLFRKGFILQSIQQVRSKIVANDEMTEPYERYLSSQRRLSAEYAKPIAERKNVEQLEKTVNMLERELARSIAGFEAAAREAKWQDVQSVLQPGEAAIEFVHYRAMAPKATDPTLYAALILLPGSASPAFIPLFEEPELITWLQGDSNTDNSAFYAGLYRGETKFVPVNKDTTQGKALYDLLWQPLEELLQGMQTVYYAPSGLLHRINLSAIQTPQAGILGERHHLIALGSSRQLVPEANIRPETYGQEIALFGGIHFDADTTLTPPPIDSMDIFAGLVLRGAPIDSTQRQSDWGYLTGTAQEVQNIQARLERQGLPVRLYSGHEASEEAFKQLGEVGRLSPRVLHLATHGFFSPDPKAISRNMDGEPVFKWSDNPMIRSGLVLAGGNHAWRHGSPLYPGMEDGILTAQEISQMNLRNTELVVLSACETGLGDIEGNEGVYGLQRAFKIAGAQYLIMSLWKVPDAETAEFMEAFYGYWLEEGRSIPDAFRMTQEEMRVRYKRSLIVGRGLCWWSRG